MVASLHYDLDTSTTLGGNSASDLKIASQKAVKTYVDGKVVDNLSDLSDVSLSSPASGEVLGYNGSNWVNTSKTLVTIRDWSAS